MGDRAENGSLHRLFQLAIVPLALSVLTIFVAYQLHRFGRTHSTILLTLTVLDTVVMVLIWREYRSRTEIVRPSATAKPRGR